MEIKKQTQKKYKDTKRTGIIVHTHTHSQSISNTRKKIQPKLTLIRSYKHTTTHTTTHNDTKTHTNSYSVIKARI